MDRPLREGMIRLIIKPADMQETHLRLIPAETMRRTFSAVLRALQIADKILHDKKHRSEFYISDLRMSSNVIEMREHSQTTKSPVDLFRQASGAVYRSEFDRVVEHEKLAKAVVAIGKSIDSSFPAIAMFESDSIPLDDFFARQASRLADAMSPSALKVLYHVGNTIGSFDGKLGNIDYRGATWIGHLVLPGEGAQIECVFDKSKGEDAYNPYGNKRVTVQGRAIYTGDSPLPERLEVFTVEEIPAAQTAVDIRGSLTGKRYFGAEGLGKYIQ